MIPAALLLLRPHLHGDRLDAARRPACLYPRQRGIERSEGQHWVLETLEGDGLGEGQVWL